MKKILFYSILLFLFLNELKAQCTDAPDELFRGRLKAPGGVYGNPYTMFDRRKPGNFYFDAMGELGRIRKRIHDERPIGNKPSGPVYDAYKAIYTNAHRSLYQMLYESNGNNATAAHYSDSLIKLGWSLVDWSDKISPAARWAKNNAFVFLIGLDSAANWMDTTSYSSQSPSNAMRNSFRDLALYAFNIIKFDVVGDDGKQQHQCKSLQMWLQAYDLLKTAREDPVLYSQGRHPLPQYDGDRNAGDCSPRNKLRRYTRDFFKAIGGGEFSWWGVVNSPSGWKKNHGLMAASTLLMASIVLNDAGTETSYITGLFGWLWGDATWPHPNWNPVWWNEYAWNGLYDNLHVGHHTLTHNVPQTNADGTAGYAEGPGYWVYVMQNMLPALRSAYNFYPGPYSNDMTEKSSVGNIIKWFDNAVTDPLLVSTYDNSTIQFTNMQSLTGNRAFNYGSISGMDGDIDLLADYVVIVATNDIPVTDKTGDNIKITPASGNAIMRLRDKNNSKHFIHLLDETGVAVDKSAFDISFLWWDWSDGTHEDNDFGSFSLSADNDWLAIDPPYLMWGNEQKTNKYVHHNTLLFNKNSDNDFLKNLFNNVLNLFTSTSSNIAVRNVQPFNGYKQTFNFEHFVNTTSPGFAFQWPPITLNSNTSFMKRNVNMMNVNGTVYYILNDYMKAPDEVNSVQFNLNGAGLETDNTFLKLSSRTYKWRYPCTLSDSVNRWALYAHVASLSNGTDTIKPIPYTSTSDDGTGTRSNGSNHIAAGTTHTRLEVKQERTKTIIQSLLFPYRCAEESQLPLVSRLESDTHVVTMVHFPTRIDTTIATWKDLGKMNNPPGVADTITHLHYARWEGSIDDTLQTSIGELKTDAVNAFVAHHYVSWAKFGACSPSYINMRHVGIDFGKYLGVGVINYVQADNEIIMNYHFTGKYKYEGFVQNVGGADSLILYLPDVTDDITDMMVEGLGSVYDAPNKLLRIKIPADSAYLRIHQADPCVNCFFPKTIETIDSTFDFNTGTTETLGHKLDIVQPIGLLNITNASKMVITCNKYFRNTDSLIMEGPCGVDVVIDPCEGIDTTFKDGDKSAIIINHGCALVLDSGSYTYIGNNSGIYVRSGGSLVIKDSAFVRIGNNLTCGRGEIIAEPGAYVYIQPGAHIEFNVSVGDTVDKHFFYLSLFPPGQCALAGVNYAIDSLLKADTLIPNTFTPIAFCDLNDVMLPAVHNNLWGYANFMPPKPHVYLRNDTLCPGEPMYVSLRRFLNDNQYKFHICRVDSFWDAHPSDGSLPHWVDTCIVDTMSRDTVYPDPQCMPPHAAPDEFWYYFKTHSLHRVTFEVKNDCGITKDTTLFVYVADSPVFAMNVPDIACPGTGTVIATTSNNLMGWYEWTVQLLDTSQMPLIYNQNQQSLIFYRHSDYGLIPDSFDFSDFRFLGGRKYLVSLCVSNSCGTFCMEDTVTIPAGAYIKLERPLVYGQPVNGATAVRLHGYVSLADSFRWEPTTWLDTLTVLTPISTPFDSITYVLIAHCGSCVAYDTTHIKYNRFANAGLNDTLCFDTNTVSTETIIGFPYDMSLFLGMLYYYDQTQFMNYYNNYNSGNAPDYFRYFTHYMHYWEFENQALSCPIDLFNLFTNVVQKEFFFKQSWYKQYYEHFTQFNDPGLPVLAEFKNAVDNDQSLKDHLDSIDNWGSIDPCMNGLFTQYNDYVTAHVNEISAAWSKVVEADTTLLNDAQNDNFFIALDAPTKSSKYILNVITPNYAEIDEMTIYLDTTLTPAFVPSMQFDSTVYFMNYTVPVSTVTSYEWSFGDGSSNSSDLNPIHTFPAFDSNYVVCLTASNLCGSWMYCDTVRIDSAHLGSQMFIVKNPPNNSNGQSKSDNELLQQIKQQLSGGQLPIALSNYPNPFGDKTIIVYQIWQLYNNAELRITNVLGQQIFSQQLTRPIDKIQIDGSILHAGLYYYSIIIDGSVKQTKIMSVIH